MPTPCQLRAILNHENNARSHDTRTPGGALRAQNLAHPEQDDRVSPGVRTPDFEAVGVPTPHFRLSEAPGDVPRGVLRGRHGRRGGHSLHDLRATTNPVIPFSDRGEGGRGEDVTARHRSFRVYLRMHAPQQIWRLDLSARAVGGNKGTGTVRGGTFLNFTCPAVTSFSNSVVVDMYSGV